MSESMLNMYISFAGIISLFLAIGLIYLSRFKLKGIFSASYRRFCLSIYDCGRIDYFLHCTQRPNRLTKEETA